MRKLIPKRVALLASVCLGFLGAATSVCVAEQLPITTYTSADGLGSSFVNALMRDSRGFLWVCTRDGLSRFDGSRFITYQVGGKNSPPGIEQILETRKGIYWITTTAGLYRFDPNAPVTAYETGSADRPALNAEFVSSERGFLYEDRTGNLWVGSNALYLVNEKEKKPVLEKIKLSFSAYAAPGFGIAAICEGRDQSLWLLTTWGVVRRFPDGREVFYSIESARNDALTSIIEDRAGRIWIARVSGVYVIEPESRNEVVGNEALVVRDLDKQVTRRLMSGNDSLRLPDKPGEILKYADAEGIVSGYAKSLYETADGLIWITNVDSLIEFDRYTFHAFARRRAAMGGIRLLVEDGSGNLWLGTANGLARLNRGGLTTFGFDDGLRETSIEVISETRENKLYVMSGAYSLGVFDGRAFQTIHPRVAPDAVVTWTANPGFQDHAGEWWFLTNEKLYRFGTTKDFHELAQRSPRATYDSRDGLTGNQMFHIFEDSRGDLWISTHEPLRSGLSRWSRTTEKFYAFTPADGLPPNKGPSSFAEDRQGNLWFGFYEGGLVRYSAGRFTEFTPADGLPNGLITALHLDQLGRLWIGSSQDGLSRIDEPSAIHARFVKYTSENGLGSNNVRTITEDLFGNIYAGTARGIDRLSPDVTRIKHYSVSDGLAGDFVTTSFRDRSGALWFGTPNGLSRLIPAADQPLAAPAVWVSGLRIAGEHRLVPELGSAEIPLGEIAPTQNNLQIDFFAIDFSSRETLRYQHKLEGADQDWSAPTLQRQVNYANLAPGAYRFLVRAVNANGLTSKNQAIVSFRILPPFWRRWWFVSLVALLLGAAVFALDRNRVRRMKALDAALAESQRSEQAARESEERFRTLSQTASDAIITVDQHSKIVFANAAAEKVFGYAPEEMTGADLTMLMPEYLRHLHRAGLANYIKTGQRHISWQAVELPGLHKSGREIPLELSFGEFTLNGERYFTGIARDITERKQATEALQRSREERLRELEQVRKRIATDLHDDIGSSLTQISIMSEVVQQRIGPDASPFTEPLSLIATSSRELVDAMSDIVWAINPQRDHLSDLIHRMRRFANDTLAPCNIELQFRAPGDEVDTQVGANVRREVFLIFKEGVNNIAKHARCTKVDVEMRFEKDKLALRIEDNGAGFDANGDGDGHGLMSMTDRARGLGGTLVIDSLSGRGTTITLDVPLAPQ